MQKNYTMIYLKTGKAVLPIFLSIRFVVSSKYKFFAILSFARTGTGSLCTTFPYVLIQKNKQVSKNISLASKHF